MTAAYRITETDLTCVGPVEFLAHPGYRIWKDGRVESDLVCGGNRRGRRSGVWRPVRPSFSGKYPHPRVTMYAGKLRNACVHALLMEVFVGPRPPNMEVRHLDGNPQNNRLDNLRYGTHIENMRDAVGHGTIAKGEENTSAKLDADKVRAMRSRWASGELNRELVERYGVSSSVVSKICQGTAWAHVEWPQHVRSRRRGIGGGEMVTTTKERPILFSGPMVKAILGGRKTQTRRVVKGVFRAPPLIDADCIKDWDGGPSRLDWAPRDWEMCPYGVPGDRLWVRETWTVNEYRELDPSGGYSAGTGEKFVDYRATSVNEPDTGWKSAQMMPRWASRITLEVTGVRVDRLNAITPEDAKSEGIEDFARTHKLTGYWTTAFSRLWDQINGEGAWAKNPWVWAVEFRRADCGEEG